MALIRAETLHMTREGTDRYDRTLMRVDLDDTPLADHMIAQGLAWRYAGGTRQGWCA